MKTLLFFLLLGLLFQNGCSQNIVSNYLKSDQNQKTNNLIDVNGDGSSELLFWNCSIKSKKTNDCFFETAGIQNTNYQIATLGKRGDLPIYGDFNGDGSTDFGVYQYIPGGNKWYLLDGLTRTTLEERFGEAGDLPVPGDYDGDGKTDHVVFRPRNNGFYGTLSDRNKWLEIHHGVTGDIPVPKDYDGDKRVDIATYRISGGSWLIKSSKNYDIKQIMLGGIDYLPIPADYDGDKKTDIAVWNYKTNDCKIIFSNFNQILSESISNEIKQKLNNIKCFPLPADYDGDGRAELVFWDYKNQKIHEFKVSANNVKYGTYTVDIKKTSKPVNYFLLNKYLKRNNIITPGLLYKKYLSLSGSKSKTTCELLETANAPSRQGKSIIDDFDGDGKCDSGLVDVEGKTLIYFSSNLERPITINLDSRVDGSPFSFDVDLDFMADPVFYNPQSMIFGFQLSSEAYRYDEALNDRGNN